MKQNLPLTVASLLSILLFTVHLAHDFVYGLDSMSRAETPTYLLIVLVSLYGTVQLAGRRSGYVITLLLAPARPAGDGRHVLSSAPGPCPSQNR